LVGAALAPDEQRKGGFLIQSSRPQADRARVMRRFATGLLGFMAIIFLAANRFASAYPLLAYVRAFAEASLVGGLADWFAVTALFRHPLGLPIPHTAIVPHNKDRIAETLGRFLRDNFLVTGVIARRLERMDLAGAIARRLARPEPSGKVRRAFASIARQMLDALDDGLIAATIRRRVTERLAGIDWGFLFADLIDAAVENGKHGALVDAGLKWAASALNDNETFIRASVKDRAGWFIRVAGLDEQISDQIIGALTKTLSELAADPAHPLRLKATGTLVGLAFDLRHDVDVRARVEGFKADVLGHATVTAYLDGLWASLKANLLKASADPDALATGGVGTALARIGVRVEGDAALRATINGYARRAIVAAVAGYGGELVSLVTDTIRGWETGTVVTKLEGIVGRDLQYIRVNGTVVGGLAGLTIYTLSRVL
jgi:uncharacterized membrane-anchored protein YjiN (DUF445 family)